MPLLIQQPDGSWQSEGQTVKAPKQDSKGRWRDGLGRFTQPPVFYEEEEEEEEDFIEEPPPIPSRKSRAPAGRINADPVLMEDFYDDVEAWRVSYERGGPPPPASPRIFTGSAPGVDMPGEVAVAELQRIIGEGGLPDGHGLQVWRSDEGGWEYYDARQVQDLFLDADPQDWEGVNLAFADRETYETEISG